MPHHDLLPSEPAIADPPAAVVAVRDSINSALRLRSWLHELGVGLVARTAGVLLYHNGQRMRHYAPRNICSPTHCTTHTTAYAATDATTNSTTAATHITTETHGTCGSFQLCSGCREHMEGGQEGLVLQGTSSWVPTHGTAAHADCSNADADRSTADASGASAAS